MEYFDNQIEKYFSDELIFLHNFWRNCQIEWPIFRRNFALKAARRLLVLIHLLLAKKHAVEGEQAGGAVAPNQLCRNVHPARKPRVIHTHIQRPVRHVKKRI